MNIRTFLFVSALLAPFSAFAQSPFPISLGVKGGAALTDAFSDSTLPFSNGTSRTYSPKHDYVVGPMLEVRLPMGVSVEGDALYRPLNLNAVQSFNGPTSTLAYSVTSWEFPILVKYHLGFPIVKPFIEAGPSFRYVKGFSATQLSTKGFSAGLGVEAKALFVRVAPEFRYTHWGSDFNEGVSGFNPESNSNQVEFLVGISF
ncbi:MAG TPA: outer membrane beta-barrel protein [Bryobacteraceae bacterium]|jgi:hypothetical protein